MSNLLTSTQMHEVDAYTIKHQPISSVDLMEKAAQQFVKIFIKKYPNKKEVISILCGQGNNGGDGLAISRLLYNDKYENIIVYLINFSTKQSKDYTVNLESLPKTTILTKQITDPEQLNNIKSGLIIDAILGSGLNKPLTGKYADLIDKVNRLQKPIIAVDVPSGFPSEGVIDENYSGIKANLAICFQLPKLNFFFPESAVALAKFKVANIGLDEEFISSMPSNWKLIVKPILNSRVNFSHKGTYGHALIIAGNNTTMGAALLAASACLRVGAGLTTLCLPVNGLVALNATLPEVMALPRNEDLAIEAFEKYTVIAIGPGLGLEEENRLLLTKMLKLKKPLVLDADALNILAKHMDLLEELPSGTILTPHVKEFDRLFGMHQNWWQRVETARMQAKARKLIIILKNQFTFVCLPNGEVHINQTGNPAMASGGMGDVLTGMIAGFLAQSYLPEDAAKLAVYVHGKAGDKLAKKRATVSAMQVSNQLPKTLKKLY